MGRDYQPVSDHHRELVDVPLELLMAAGHQDPLSLQGCQQGQDSWDVLGPSRPQRLVIFRGIEHQAAAVSGV